MSVKRLGKGLGALIRSDRNIDVDKNLESDASYSGVSKINISEIKANPNQPRRFFDEKKLLELVDSIKQKGVIKMDKAKIMSIKRTKNNFNLKTNNKNKSIISSDILVSVLGPENTLSLIKSEGVYKDIYDLNKKEINKDGYVVNKNFQLKNQKNVYLPGFLSSGYNSQRQTIIKAITENSIKASNHLFRKYKY